MHTKRAIIFAGGSVRGIFQLGVLDRILKEEPDREYSFLGGNSVGALTAAYLAQYPYYFLNKGLLDLLKVWYSLKGSKDLWRFGPLSLIRPLYCNGIANANPLKKLIQENFDPERVKKAGRKLRISTVDVLAGEYIEFDETNVTWEAIYGSAAMPFALPTIQVGDKMLSDGGLLSNGPVKSAIKAGCKEIDIILNGPIDRDLRVLPVKQKDVNTLAPFAMRALELILDQQFYNDLKVACLYNKLARADLTDKVEVFIRIYAPVEVLSSEILLLGFTPEQLRQWFTDGLNTAPVTLEEYIRKAG